MAQNVNAGGGKGKQMYLEAKLDANSLRATLAQVKAAFAKQSTHLKRLKAEKKLLVREVRRVSCWRDNSAFACRLTPRCFRCGCSASCAVARGLDPRMARQWRQRTSPTPAPWLATTQRRPSGQ